jgi:uncharacterized protein YcbK (DUF882 family)
MTLIISRRNFLVGGATLATSSLIIPRFGLATSHMERKVALYNIHTGEWFKQNYVEAGRYVPDALKEMQHFLRDHRNDAQHPINPRLIDLLYDLQRSAGLRGQVFDVISGYRSPASNALLRRKGRCSVARNSYHMKGCAIDIRCRGNTKLIKDLARSLKMGGVGYYPRSGFVHVDVRAKPAYWAT